MNFLLSLVFFLTGATAETSAPPESVVVCENATGRFSGVVVDPRGFIMTAKHVGLSPIITVVLSNGRNLEARLVYVGDDHEDILGYQLPPGKYKFSPLAKTRPKKDEHVETWGYPAHGDYGREWTHADGEIMGGLLWRGSRMNLVFCQTFPGWSGGPLFNDKREVIGCLSAGNAWVSLFITHREMEVAFKGMDAIYKADREVPFSPPLHPTSFIKEVAYTGQRRATL